MQQFLRIGARLFTKENLFALPGVSTKIDEGKLIAWLSANVNPISDVLYDPSALVSSYGPGGIGYPKLRATFH